MIQIKVPTGHDTYFRPRFKQCYKVHVVATFTKMFLNEKIHRICVSTSRLVSNSIKHSFSINNENTKDIMLKVNI